MTDDKTSRKNISRAIINVLHVFKKLAENNIMKKEVENIKRELWESSNSQP